MAVNAGRVSVVPKGDFVNGTQYTRLDLVTYEDGLYIAKKNNKSILPTNSEYWMFIMNATADYEIKSVTEPKAQTIGNYWLLDY